MDVLNKLRSTVSSTVSQLSGVLPGNPVTREFEITRHVCSAGPGLLWKVYDGYKKSTKQPAAVFVFEKKQLEKWPREARDPILEALRRGVGQLTRLRHPQILTVHHPIEESRESLAFATEPVSASLANVLGNYENAPVNQFRDFTLFDLEIKYGLLQVGEGLIFLHNDVKLIHSNLCPESIILNQEGVWKIFGFDFCLHATQPDQKSWQGQDYSTLLPALAQPNLDYLAPEAGLKNVWLPANDMYALGAMIYAIFNKGSSIFQFHDNLADFKSRIIQLKTFNTTKLNVVPNDLRDTVKMLLNFDPHLRLDPYQFKKIPFFEDVNVKTLNTLDCLFQMDKLQKSQFYKGLQSIVEKFPHRICINRVIPCLGKEFANPAMVPFVLPCVFYIAEKSTKEEYMAHILPLLQSAMKLTEPVKVLLLLMQKMELLLKMTPSDEVKNDVLPMMYRALECDTQQIQVLCLNGLPTYSSLLDYPAMKNAVLPRIKKLCLTTPHLSVRVNCLVCIGKLLNNLDKWLVLDEILPFLEQIPAKEPAVLMAILGIIKLAMTHVKLGIPKEVLANKVIPFLMPLSIDNGLSLSQFNIIFALLKDMIHRVETEHRSKLEQLSAITAQTNSLDLDQSYPHQTTNNSFDLPADIFGTIDQAPLNDEKPKETPKTAMVPPIQRDLTSTLMATNLAQMSSSLKSPPSTNWSTVTPSSHFSQGMFSGLNFSQTPVLQPMSPFSSPSWTTSPSPTVDNVKKLSSSEINDFLS